MYGLPIVMVVIVPRRILALSVKVSQSFAIKHSKRVNESCKRGMSLHERFPVKQEQELHES